MKTHRRLIFNLFHIDETYNASQFGDFAHMAKSFGATHLNIGVLPYHYSWFLPDNSDPYASWQNYSMGLFRVMTPPVLRPWIDQDESRYLLEVMTHKVEILRELGLRATICNGVEPCWLPEGVYRKYPHWRGSQCELGRIAKRPYFAPSIDHPEVLDLYRWSIESLCRLLPEIDQFTFLTNDSGAGVSWSTNTYPGINGPMAYRGRGFGSRVTGWLNALREGAEQAGSDAIFHLHSVGFTPTEREAAAASLTEKTYLGFKNSQEKAWQTASATFGSDFWSPTWPALGIASPIDFVEKLQHVYDPAGTCDETATVQCDEAGLSFAKVLLTCFKENPGQGLLNQMHVLLDAAGVFVGGKHADSLVQTWKNVDAAILHMSSVFDRGMSVTLSWGEVCARWLIRPLVPLPGQLTDLEVSHYEAGLFSVADRKKNADLCYVLGKSIFNGSSAVWMARWNFQKAIGLLQQACQALDEMADDLPEGISVSAVKLYAMRLKALEHLVENAKLTIWYQHALNIAYIPRFAANAADFDDNIQYDQRALELRKIARADLDNTAALLALLRSTDEPLIAQAQTPEGESVFKFGPDIAGALQKKMDIMWDHWQDYETLYPTAKEREFDPENTPCPTSV